MGTPAPGGDKILSRGLLRGATRKPGARPGWVCMPPANMCGPAGPGEVSGRNRGGWPHCGQARGRGTAPRPDCWRLPQSSPEAGTAKEEHRSPMACSLDLHIGGHRPRLTQPHERGAGLPNWKGWHSIPAEKAPSVTSRAHLGTHGGAQGQRPGSLQRAWWGGRPSHTRVTEVASLSHRHLGPHCTASAVPFSATPPAPGGAPMHPAPCAAGTTSPLPPAPSFRRHRRAAQAPRGQSAWAQRGCHGADGAVLPVQEAVGGHHRTPPSAARSGAGSGTVPSTQLCRCGPCSRPAGAAGT